MKTFSIFAEDDGPIPAGECAKVSYTLVHEGELPGSDVECATMMTSTEELILQGLELIVSPLLYTGTQGTVWIRNISDSPREISIGQRLGEGVWIRLW